MNSHCLEGLAWPHCGSESPFDIASTTVALFWRPERL